MVYTRLITNGPVSLVRWFVELTTPISAHLLLAVS